jgi:hypothetical protein
MIQKANVIKVKRLHMTSVLLFCLFLCKDAVAQYCSPSLGFGSCQSFFIASIHFNDLNNSSGCTPTGYTYYDNTQANVEAGQIFSLLVQVQRNALSIPPTDNAFFAAWIDFNHDAVFNTNEYISLPSAASSFVNVSSASILIPVTVTAGLTRMRIMASINAPLSASSSCGVPPINSEVEDYVVNITYPPCPALQGGTLVSSVDSICQYESAILTVQNSSTNLSIAGVSVKWQRSSDGINWVKDYGRSSNVKDTVSIYKDDTDTTFDRSWNPVYFRRIIYCGGDSAVSTTAQVGYAPCYPCTPKPLHCNAAYYISRVQMAGLDNSSGCSSTNGYTDYGATVPTLQLYKDSIYTYRMKTNGSAFNAMWIDYNRDGIFESYETDFPSFSPDSTRSYYGNYGIPPSASTGPSKMRFFYKADPDFVELYLGGFESCNGTYYSKGEIEDYAIYINDNPNCGTTSDTASWRGYKSSAWDDPQNWRCGKLPGSTTKVFIPAKAFVIISSNTSVYSLTVSPNATLKVIDGVSLLVLH